MREIDHDGLTMCRVQGKIFEKSIDQVNVSSPVFVRNYLNGIDAYSMDKECFLNTCRYDDQILEDLNKKKPYGKTKYTIDEMYWMGYLYRYFAYTYNISSKQIYKILPAEKLRKVYYAYHTMDVSLAIERILEAGNIKIGDKNNINEKVELFINEKLSKQKIVLKNE